MAVLYLLNDDAIIEVECLEEKYHSNDDEKAKQYVTFFCKKIKILKVFDFKGNEHVNIVYSYSNFKEIEDTVNITDMNYFYESYNEALICNQKKCLNGIYYYFNLNGFITGFEDSKSKFICKPFSDTHDIPNEQFNYEYKDGNYTLSCIKKNQNEINYTESTENDSIEYIVKKKNIIIKKTVNNLKTVIICDLELNYIHSLIKEGEKVMFLDVRNEKGELVLKKVFNKEKDILETIFSVFTDVISKKKKCTGPKKESMYIKDPKKMQIPDIYKEFVDLYKKVCKISYEKIDTLLEKVRDKTVYCIDY